MDIKRYLKFVICTVGYLFVFFYVHLAEADWQIETVDSVGNFGQRSSLALDSNDNPHITYYEGDYQYDLKYGHYDGSWHIETVDSSGRVGEYNSIAVDTNGNPHICYYDSTNNDLKYAYLNGSWQTEILDDSGGISISLTLDENNNPHVSYRDPNNSAVKYAYKDGNWHIAKIDGGGSYPSLVLDSNDNPRIAYCGPSNFRVKYAWCDVDCHNTGNWNRETIYDMDHSVSYTALALNSTDEPHIIYRGTGGIKHAYYKSTWAIQTLGIYTSSYPSFAIDAQDNLHISYDGGELKHMYYNNCTWHIEIIDPDAGASGPCSLVFDSNNKPHTSYYYSTDHDLRYAFEEMCLNDYDCDVISDNDDKCPLLYNPLQEDEDSDAIGDVCDNCPSLSNADQVNNDTDCLGNVCDNCPYDYNPGQEDLDSDGLGDICDNDVDGDELLPDFDNCPLIYNPVQEDTDGDGFGDVCDSKNGFVLIDRPNFEMVAFDVSGDLLFKKGFREMGLFFFVSPSIRGWVVKGCPPSGCSSANWIIWDLNPDGSTRNTITDLGPGPFFTGLANGNFISGNVYSGVIDLYNTSGTIIDNTNVWNEPGGWSYDYSLLGDVAGLSSGGFVVPPEGGYPDSGGEHTPYLYFYDNNLKLINKRDITSENVHLFDLAGLSDGGFVATCSDSGSTIVDYLCYFNSSGDLIDKRDISAEILGYRYWKYVFIAGLHDGGVIVTLNGQTNVWIYHSPPQEIDLSTFGVSGVDAIAGNTFDFDLDGDGFNVYIDNCPEDFNPLQEDQYPPGGNGIGDACDCECDFTCDGDVDADDVTDFITDFGREQSLNPCTNAEPCNGDFDCDVDVDANDLNRFLEDFGREQAFNPCPSCVGGDWCVYP